MPEKLYWNTVTPLLQSGLRKLMSASLFDRFRLVGGTSLSLQIGHRMSVDIDLFTDATYETINFQQIDDYLRQEYTYVRPGKLPERIVFGISYILGNKREESFKLDLYYTDQFIFPSVNVEGMRLASKAEIAAMKIDVLQRGGRKKDFWDVHALLDDYTMEYMIDLHEQRYPYTHDATLINANLTRFAPADEDFNPVCLLGKHWETIMLDFTEIMNH